MIRGARVLLAWEETEENSWNPVLASMLRDHGHDVVEVTSFEQLRTLDLGAFDLCLPRFRICSAAMTRIDEALCASNIPMLNSRDARVASENKALSYQRFEMAGLPQPPAVVVDCEGTVDEAPTWSGETLAKPISGSRSLGIEIFPSPEVAVEHARGRREDVLVQQMIWPARSWRVITGRHVGAVDPYWRRPPSASERVHAISTGSAIARDPAPPAVEELALEMLDAVGGDLLAADVLERDGQAWALEINHNFDAHGGDELALDAFRAEIGELIVAEPARLGS